MIRTSSVRSTVTVTKAVASSATAVELLAVPSMADARNGISIYNASTSPLSIRLGPPAELTAGTVDVKVAAGGYYEAPFGYVGQIAGMWDSVNGSAMVTEYA